MTKANEVVDNMKIKAVIFDLDGVLTKTDEQHYQAWKALADREGIPFDRSLNDKQRGVSRMESLEVVLSQADCVYTQEEKLEMAEWKNDVYVRLLGEITGENTLPGAVEALSALHANGLKLAVGSSSKNAKLILGKLGLTDVFDAIADGTDITRSKPDPEVFLCAAAKLGLEPEVCAVVEDAFSGIEAAKAANMFAVAFGGDAVKHPDADAIIEQLIELPDVVGA